MNTEPTFASGDIVRLKKDLKDTNLKTGDYGIVWAVYPSYIDENKKSLAFDYEGTFWNKRGDYDDAMFEEEDVEKVLKLEETPYSEDMKEFWFYLNQK